MVIRNFNILLDGDVSTNITSIQGDHSVLAPFYEHIFTPETDNQLDSFDGENANGNWTLGICDDAGVDTGTIDRILLNFGQSDFGDAPNGYGRAQHSTPRIAELEPIIVPNVGAAVVTVYTENTYTEPVVVCTYNLHCAPADDLPLCRVDSR